jgi:AcrR family transcriptional regulator
MVARDREAPGGPAPAEWVDGDGRRLRAARNRESVVTAVLEIIRAQNGGPLPSAAEVARRARVSERTVFRHFADLDSLLVAAAAHQRPTLVAHLVPRPDQPELERRIAAIVRLRSKLYEEIAPVRRVATRLAQHHQVLAATIEEAHQSSRSQLADTFQPELRRVSGARKRALLDELDVITSWEVWETLRTRQGCSIERTKKILADLLSVVLSPLESRPSRRRS